MDGRGRARRPRQQHPAPRACEDTAGTSGRAPGRPQDRADTPAPQQRPTRPPGAAAGAVGASGACAAARAAARAPGCLRWPIRMSQCSRVRVWPDCRADAPLQAGHAGSRRCVHARLALLCAHLRSPRAHATLCLQRACVQRCSTAGRGGCEGAPASQSSMAMMARYIIWQSDGAAGSGLGAPVAAAPLALEKQPLARRAGPGAPSSRRARAASGHQLSSSRQSSADSTTPLGTLVADPVGRPQCRVPHMAVPQDTGLTQPLACLNAAPQPPRRHSARFTNP